MKGGERTPDSPAYDERGCDPAAPLFPRLAATGIAGLLRAIYATARGEDLTPEVHRQIVGSPPLKCILAFWHRHVGLAPYFSRDFPWCSLVSRSRDGELLARIMASLGGRSVRGSSGRIGGRNKGGALALRQLARAAERKILPIFTPDGPKGPAEKVKPGVIYLGSMTGLPIYPVGFAVTRSARLPTWDGTIIPAPFARLIVSCGEPLEVPPSIDGAGLEARRAEFERRLLEANERARASIRPGGE